MTPTQQQLDLATVAEIAVSRARAAIAEDSASVDCRVEIAAAPRIDDGTASLNWIVGAGIPTIKIDRMTVGGTAQ